MAHCATDFSCCIFHMPTCACVSVCVCECGCVCVCACMYAFVCDDFLLFPYHSFFHPPLFWGNFFPFLPLPLPPTPLFPPLPCVCVYVCVLFFPFLFPPTLKTALHHPPPLHSLSCFDLCYQGISCVRLMGFSPGTPVFPFIPRDVLNWIFALPFPRLDFTYCLFFLHHL